MKKLKLAVFDLTVGLALTLLVTACSGSSQTTSSPVTNSPSPTVETAPTEKSAASSPYNVDFSEDTANVSLEGFSFPEDWGRWTDGSPASIKFVQDLPSSFELIFKAKAFGPNVNKDIIISV
nr:hypothetical protein [Microcystis aeruginosa LG13-11]